MPKQEFWTEWSLDSREPFIRDLDIEAERDANLHKHDCPVCHETYNCREIMYLPDGDSDQDCRWYKEVICPPCLKRRSLVNG